MSGSEIDPKAIRPLADHSRKFRSGLAQLLEQGADPDELDRLIDNAEAALEQEDKALAKRQATRKAVRRF